LKTIEFESDSGECWSLYEIV